MRYESAKTEKGNIGVSYESQEAADSQAAAMDCTGCRYCTNCTNCTGCTDCTGCTNCTGCTGCRYCTNCTGCTGCTNCTGCTGCTNCTGCTGCRYCTNCTGCTGVLRWAGAAAQNLLALNGLYWPVAISESEIQIGCQCHTHREWETFSDAQIYEMAQDEALAFCGKHKALIMVLAAMKKGSVS